MQDIQQRLAAGTYVDTRLTVANYLNQWLEEKARHVKANTLEQYTYCIKKHLTPHLGMLALNKVTPLQVQAMIRHVADHTGVPTANKSRVVLFNAYKLALRWQLVVRNPVEAVDPLPQPERELRLWSPKEAARFLDVAHAHRLYALFYLAMSTGLRRGELLGLRWQDVTDDRLMIQQALVKVGSKLRLSTPKTKNSRRLVATSPDVSEVLREHQGRQKAECREAGDLWISTDLVFTSELGTPVDPDNLRRVRLKLNAEAKAIWRAEALAQDDTTLLRELDEDTVMAPIRLHDFRHLHSSVCIRNGMDPKMLADRLGHARASFTLDRYTHLFEEQRETSAVSLLDFLPEKAVRSSN
jgi:integrase